MVQVIDAESMYDIDSTGALVLLELLDVLDDMGVGLSFARLRTELRDEMESAGVDTRLAGDGIYLEVDDAVADYLARTAVDPSEPGLEPPTG